MDLKLAKRDYDAQRFSAKSRGIEWDFTFNEWVVWWFRNVGPDWQSLRGCKKNDYVMSRIGDKGSYTRSNVHLNTASGNGRDRAVTGASLKGSDHARAKLTDNQVEEIYKSEYSNRSLARKYGVHTDTVAFIKNGTHWGHLTKTFGPPPVRKYRTPIETKHSGHHMKMTDEIVKQIFYAKGSERGIAKRFGVSPPTVGKVKRRETWRHITSTL